MAKGEEEALVQCGREIGASEIDGIKDVCARFPALVTAGFGALAAAPSIPNHTCRYRSPEEEMAAREEALTEQTRMMRFARRSSAGTSSGTAIRLPLTARRSWFAANC